MIRIRQSVFEEITYQALFERWLEGKRHYRAKTFTSEKNALDWLNEMNLLFDDTVIRYKTKKDLKSIKDFSFFDKLS